MSTVERKFEDMVEWDGNPRPPASAETRSEMRASLQHTGQIMPLIGREKGNKVEIVAGRNRLRSIGELISENLWPADKPIIVQIREMTDAEALEIATSENINIPMHPMHQFEAFKRMVELGKDPIDIANTYGVSQRIVERRLSFAKLDERARELVKNNERDLEWASAMTLASPSEQNAILEEIDVDPRRFRGANEIRSRMQDDLIPLSYAIFDVSKADDKLVRRDLFDPNDESYMHRKDFLPLQDAALKVAVEEAKNDGWADVVVTTEKEFDIYKYVDNVEKSKGSVIFVRHSTGEIVIYQGMALRFEEKISSISAEDEDAAASIFGDDNDDADIDIRAMLSDEEDENVYVESSRTVKHLKKEKAAIAQKMILEDPKAAMAVTIAGLIGASTARPLDGKPFEDLADLDKESLARRAIEEKSQLAHDIMRSAKIDPYSEYPELLKGLYSLSEGDLMIIYQVELARRIPTDLPRLDALTDGLLDATKTTISEHWVIDRTFLSTLSVKSLRALAENVLPARLLGKLGKGKGDSVETIAEIALDAHQSGGRLDATERNALKAWAPKELGGDQYEDVTSVLTSVDGLEEEDGFSLFEESDIEEDDESNGAGTAAFVA